MCYVDPRSTFRIKRKGPDRTAHRAGKANEAENTCLNTMQAENSASGSFDKPTRKILTRFAANWYRFWSIETNLCGQKSQRLAADVMSLTFIQCSGPILRFRGVGEDAFGAIFFLDGNTAGLELNHPGGELGDPWRCLVGRDTSVWILEIRFLRASSWPARGR